MNRLILALALPLVLLAASWAAAHDRCGGCGCACAPQKICVLKCEVKKVPTAVYSAQCEDFCVPGPSRKCGTICEEDECGCPRTKIQWEPQCAEVKTRVKLVKKTVQKEQKVYTWEVKSLCEPCAKQAAEANDALLKR